MSLKSPFRSSDVSSTRQSKSVTLGKSHISSQHLPVNARSRLQPHLCSVHADIFGRQCSRTGASQVLYGVNRGEGHNSNVYNDLDIPKHSASYIIPYPNCTALRGTDTPHKVSSSFPFQLQDTDGPLYLDNALQSSPKTSDLYPIPRGKRYFLRHIIRYLFSPPYNIFRKQ
jgi:hypothetical protein